MSQEKNPINHDDEDNQSTKGFEVVSEEDAKESDSFKMRKKNSDGSWESAAPVHVTDAQTQSSAERDEQAQNTQPIQPPERVEPAAAYEDEDVPIYEPGVKKKKHHKRGKIFCGVAAGLVVAAVGGFSAYMYLCPTIFPGVTVAQNYKLEGMSEAEAENYIDTTCTTELLGQEIKVTSPDKEFVVDVSKLASNLDSASSAHEAYLVGRVGNYFQRARTVLTSMFGGWDVSVDVVLDNDAIEHKVKRIYKKVEVDPIQPSWKVSLEKETLTVDTGTQGLDFDKNQVIDDLSEKILHMEYSDYELPTYATDQEKPNAEAIAEDVNKDAKNATVSSGGSIIYDAQVGVSVSADTIADKIGNAKKQTYKIPLEITQPTVTKSELEDVLFRDVLASATTYYNSGLSARTNNLTLAAYACSGTILNAGDTFSYNDVVGPRTTARGYRSAIIFSEGQEIQGIGGGICQISSTMYMAVLRADLNVTERRNHQFQVSYTPIAQDATVAYGSQDFKFVNNTNYPVKVVTRVGGGSVTVSLVGTKTSNKSVSLSSRVTSSTSRTKTAVLYKTVTENGNTNTTRENISTYLLD